MIWLGLITIGLEGVAIAFFSLYVMYIAAVYGISSYLIGFNWSASTRRLLFMQTPIFVAAFLTGRMLTIWPATYIGVVITIVVGVLCLRGLVQRIGQEHKICQLVFRVPGLRWCCGV